MSWHSYSSVQRGHCGATYALPARFSRQESKKPARSGLSFPHWCCSVTAACVCEAEECQHTRHEHQAPLRERGNARGAHTAHRSNVACYRYCQSSTPSRVQRRCRFQALPARQLVSSRGRRSGPPAEPCPAGLDGSTTHQGHTPPIKSPVYGWVCSRHAPGTGACSKRRGTAAARAERLRPGHAD